IPSSSASKVISDTITFFFKNHHAQVQPPPTKAGQHTFTPPSYPLRQLSLLNIPLRPRNLTLSTQTIRSKPAEKKQNPITVKMAGGQPGGNSRGRGGKFRKFTRGGGKHFSRDLRPLDADGNEINMWAAGSKKKDEESSEEDSEEDSEEESDSDEGGAAQAELSRADRKAAAKARKDAAIAKKKAQAVEVGDLPPSDSEEESSDDDMPANPNHSKASRNQTKAPAPSADVDEAAEGVKKLTVANNRKERESMEAAQAKERYRKLHEAGKTDEAKADLARLRLIREQRAADAARRDAEREEREAQEAAKKKEIEAKEAKKREAALGPSAKKGKKSSK
ncbi:hypothetical protein CLIM01_09846, partial [Colletotrichum limetticola]